jgi:hypothetical protein
MAAQIGSAFGKLSDASGLPVEALKGFAGGAGTTGIKGLVSGNFDLGDSLKSGLVGGLTGGAGALGRDFGVANNLDPKLFSKLASGTTSLGLKELMTEGGVNKNDLINTYMPLALQGAGLPGNQIMSSANSLKSLYDNRGSEKTLASTLSNIGNIGNIGANLSGIYNNYENQQKRRKG